MLSCVNLKVFAERFLSHMQDNGIVERFQSAYKTNHSTETALLRVYNDMLISIDQGGGATLVLLDLIQLIMPYCLIFGKIPIRHSVILIKVILAWSNAMCSN